MRLLPNERESEESPARERLGWKAVVSILALHVTGVAVATYPTVLKLGTTLPEGGDPLQHLWGMRWYKTCLLEGRPTQDRPDRGLQPRAATVIVAHHRDGAAPPVPHGPYQTGPHG